MRTTYVLRLVCLVLIVILVPSSVMAAPRLPAPTVPREIQELKDIFCSIFARHTAAFVMMRDAGMSEPNMFLYILQEAYRDREKPTSIYNQHYRYLSLVRERLYHATPKWTETTARAYAMRYCDKWLFAEPVVHPTSCALQDGRSTHLVRRSRKLCTANDTAR